MNRSDKPAEARRTQAGTDNATTATPALVDQLALAAATPTSRIELLNSAYAGLTISEAADRLRRFGANEPVRLPTARPLSIFVVQLTHTLAVLLWFAAGLAFAAGIVELGTAIVAVVLINGVFAFIQEYRSEQVVASMMKQVAVRARVYRGGSVQTMSAVGLVPGDVIRLVAGDIVPADCVLIKSDNIAVDLSMLTGETLPVERSPEPAVLAAGPISDVSCLLPSGAGVVSGSGLAAVYATGIASTIGALARLVAEVERQPSMLERQVADLSRLTATIAVLAGAATLGIAALLTETTFVSALTFSTGIIVALVPEGLLPTLSVSLAIGAQRMAQRGAAVRRLSAVEVVGSVTVICTDKTGTLTENRLSVEGFLDPEGKAQPAREALLVAALCNDARDETGTIAGDPLDVALWLWAQSGGLEPSLSPVENPRLDEVPFDARVRYMSVTCEVDGRPQRFVKGAPEAVLGLTELPALPEPLERAMHSATANGQRVLAFATGETNSPMRLLGLALLNDPPREGVRDAIGACRAAGIRVVMLTGDHRGTASAVAQTIGLLDDVTRVAEGVDIDRMNDRELVAFLRSDAVVARVDPQQKLRIVSVLRDGGEVVVVTGDGVNDGPALRAADVGVAMGLRGTEVAKQAADIVLADDNFVTIVAAIEEGRSIKVNIRRFISYVFTSNVAEMVPFLVYLFFPVPLPLAVIQALAIDIGTDLLPALGLGAERPSRQTMASPPEPPARPLMTRALGVRTFLFFGAIEAALGLAGFFAFYLVEGWRLGDAFEPFAKVSHEATTITFLAIVGGQVGCLFAQREGTILHRLWPRDNPLVIWGLAFELTLSIVLVYTPGLNRAFSMAPVEAHWLLSLPVAAGMFLAMDQLRRAADRDVVRNQHRT